MDYNAKIIYQEEIDNSIEQDVRICRWVLHVKNRCKNGESAHTIEKDGNVCVVVLTEPQVSVRPDYYWDQVLQEEIS